MPDYLPLVRPQTTQLTPTAEQLFQAQTQGLQSPDYDLRALWSRQGGGQLPPGHSPDTFKLPNHPTFSTDSIYSTPTTPGGVWAQLPDGRWTFSPSQTNLDQGLGASRLADYFARREPGNLLLGTLPP